VSEFGYFALCLALVAAGHAVLASVAGARRGHEPLIRSGEYAALLVCALLTVSVGSLWYSLITHDFRVQFVAENSSRAMPLTYVVAALWGGQSGSLLFWGWLLSVYAAAVVLLYRRRHRPLMPYVVATMATSSFFFVLLNLFAADPFKTLPFVPADGRGLNPLLQHPIMAIHPPMLYLGMVGMAVPFAFGIAALLTRQTDLSWLRPARRWTLIPWTFLGAGLLLGGKWAYVVLGWGGYWGWDPVENSSLIPWLSSTAFLHSVMVQERRGMLKVWNLVLVILTYALCIFGTFITRSGVVSSVHAFARSNIGSFFVVFLVLLLVFSLGLLWLRRRDLRPENRLESFASRETAFLLNNWILLGILFAVLWGTLFPIVSEAFTSEKVTVGPPFFNQINVPIGLALLLLTGAGPLFAWRRTSVSGLRRGFLLPLLAALLAVVLALAAGVRGAYPLVSLLLCGFVLGSIVIEYVRGVRARQRSTGEGAVRAVWLLLAKSRRRYGGYLIHLAVVLLFVGFTGAAFTTDQEVVLSPGQSAQIRGYTLTFETLADRQESDRRVSAAALSLFEGGRFLCTLLPQRSFYPGFDQTTTEVSIRSSLLEDFYLILVGVSEDGSAKFQVYVNPLVTWVWIGSVLLVLASLWTLWPSAHERRLALMEASAPGPGVVLRA
jgi:cytochrome c-type biogenesis protein CcmF